MYGAWVPCTAPVVSPSNRLALSDPFTVALSVPFTLTITFTVALGLTVTRMVVAVFAAVARASVRASA